MIKSTVSLQVSGRTEIAFNPSDRVRIVTGLRDVATIGRYPHRMSKPDRIVVHPRYMPKENDQVIMVKMEVKVIQHRQLRVQSAIKEKFNDVL